MAKLRGATQPGKKGATMTVTEQTSAVPPPAAAESPQLSAATFPVLISCWREGFPQLRGHPTAHQASRADPSDSKRTKPQNQSYLL